MSQILDLAKTYSQNGWQCFPLRPRDKTPTVKWADVATSEENMLLGWFDTQPDANIAIACGKRSGIVVLDVDAGHDGYESLQNLQDVFGVLPETRIAKTGGGGEHIFFKHPGIEIRNSAGKLGKGLDIRGDGGYVVAAPSVHPNGNTYEWVTENVPLADMPDWMIAELQKVEQKDVPVVTNGKVVNGSRNNSLASIAGVMRRKGLDEDTIFIALKDHNQKHCMPPLPDGEVLQIAKSIGRYAPAPVKAEPALTNPHSVIDELEASIIEREKDPRDVWGIHYAWPFLSLATGGKQKGDFMYVAGEPGVGKSWWVFQDALFTALGDPEKNIPETPTFVWSGEMPAKQTYRRFFEMLGVPKRAMLTGYNMSEYWDKFNQAKALITNSPLYVSDCPLDLSNVESLLEREIGEHGIEYAVFDYDWLISAPGSGEIETSQNISRHFKVVARKLNIPILLISSVSKLGMDTTADPAKSVMSGSGKKIHDADIVYLLTKLNEKKVPDWLMRMYSPADYWKIVTLSISKGRDLDYYIPDKKILYARETPNPKFKELREVKEQPTTYRERKDLE